MRRTCSFQRVYGTLDKPLKHFKVWAHSRARADDVDGVLEFTPLAHRGFFRLHSLLLNLRVESFCIRAL